MNKLIAFFILLLPVSSFAAKDGFSWHVRVYNANENKPYTFTSTDSINMNSLINGCALVVNEPRVFVVRGRKYPSQVAAIKCLFNKEEVVVESFCSRNRYNDGLRDFTVFKNNNRYDIRIFCGN